MNIKAITRDEWDRREAERDRDDPARIRRRELRFERMRNYNTNYDTLEAMKHPGFTPFGPGRAVGWIKQDDSCWRWTGVMRGSYPTVSMGVGNKVPVVRELWRRAGKGLVSGVLRRCCATPGCVNPDHYADVPRSFRPIDVLAARWRNATPEERILRALLEERDGKDWDTTNDPQLAELARSVVEKARALDGTASTT